MSTDRELLELAAKANWMLELADEEVSFRYDEKENGILYLHADNQDHNGLDREFVWNPLEQDHDAFGLSVKLGMQVTINLDDQISVAHAEPCPNGFAIDHEGDAISATRLAIVRAAAEIGKAKEDK